MNGLSGRKPQNCKSVIEGLIMASKVHEEEASSLKVGSHRRVHGDLWSRTREADERSIPTDDSSSFREEGPSPPLEGQCVQNAADANPPGPPGLMNEDERYRLAVAERFLFFSFSSAICAHRDGASAGSASLRGIMALFVCS